MLFQSQKLLHFPICICLCFFSCKSSLQENQPKNNHLLHETSVYLLQHAHNPVDWYPWGDEALQKAKKEHKLIIVSIGYSSCHWCHVMERETFTDTAASRIMNAHFVSIKVDREERPDIDNVYMTACQIINQDGGCGWPLNAICLPDGRPVWVGTYLTTSDWLKLISQIQSLFTEDINELEMMASQIQNNMEVDHKFKISTTSNFSIEKFKKFHQKIIPALDFTQGGKKGQIKFPLPALIQYAIEYYQYTKDKSIQKWIELTLKNLYTRGIYDQLEGGISRYATDPEWKVPHFEKMLYDNAQLISVYAMAFQLFQDSIYKNAVDDMIGFLENHFKDKSGYLHSSYDAESEGEEGKYYVWSLSEIRKLIPDEGKFQIFIAYYAITANGNWEHSKNVLSAYRNIEEMATLFKTTTVVIASTVKECEQILKEERNKRIRPKKDDKLVCSWNAMASKAYADAYAATKNEQYKTRALESIDYIKSNLLQVDYSLRRTLKNKTAAINGFLDDYSFTIQALLRIYEITFDEFYLNLAKSLCTYVIQHFSDDQDILFYFNSTLDPKLISRKMELDDQVTPSTNSVMCEALYKLGLYFNDQEFLNRSKSMLSLITQQYLEKDPIYFHNWGRLYMQQAKPFYEVAIVGEHSKKIQQEMLNHFTPHAILLGGTTEGSLELLKEKLQEGNTYIYVCRNKVCKLPVTEVSQALKLMN